MPGGSISRPLFSVQENDELIKHLTKHKVYPYKWKFRKTINGTNFNVSDGSLGSYFTLTWNPSFYTGIVYFATNFIITPNTTVGTFAIVFSYSSTFSFGDNANANTPDSEGQDAYMLLSNGAAINDFQVFFPLNWYIEKGKTLYTHIWADATTVTAGTSTIAGQVTFGCLVTNRQ